MNPDLSDSEFMEQEQNDLQEQGIAGSDAIDAPTPGMGADEYGMEDEDEGEIDEELAAELDLALGDEGEEGDVTGVSEYLGVWRHSHGSHDVYTGCVQCRSRLQRRVRTEGWQ